MPDKTHFQPEGYHTVNPYLAVKGASKLLEFLQNAFAAKIVVEPFCAPDGTIMHAAVSIGDSIIGLADAPAEPSRATLSMYVEDTDAPHTTGQLPRAPDRCASQWTPSTANAARGCKIHAAINGGWPAAPKTSRAKRYSAAPNPTQRRPSPIRISLAKPRQRIFTARAASRAIIVKEIRACTIITPFAQRDSTAVSVGENAVLVLNARNK